jgi:hypothetical protein
MLEDWLRRIEGELQIVDPPQLTSAGHEVL